MAAGQVTRKSVFISLVVGLLLGLVGGAVLGWFAHQYYYQQRLGQILLCRQRAVGQTETELQRLCGSIY